MSPHPHEARPLDALLAELRHDPLNRGDSAVTAILGNLGLSALQRRRLIRTGIGACCLGMLAAALVAGGVSRQERIATPPALTLITHGSGPLASL